MHRVAAAFTLAMMMAQCGRAAPPPSVAAESVPAHTLQLPLPRPLREGEAVFLQVQVGVIGPGQEIEIIGTDGRGIGTISPHGIRAGHAAGVYTLPLPRDVIQAGRVVIALRVTRSGAAPRAPSAGEVREVRLVVADAPPTPR